MGLEVGQKQPQIPQQGAKGPQGPQQQGGPKGPEGAGKGKEGEGGDDSVKVPKKFLEQLMAKAQGGQGGKQMDQMG